MKYLTSLQIKKRFRSTQIYFYKIMLRITWTEHASKEEVLVKMTNGSAKNS